MESGIIIRQFTATDAENVGQNGLLKTLSNLTNAPKLDGVKARSIYDEISAMEKSVILVAEEVGGQLIGFIKLVIDSKFSHGTTKAGRIEDVVVRQGYEGQGIASKLLNKAIGIARKMKCYKITLSCKQELVNFYGKFGFRTNEISMRLNL